MRYEHASKFYSLEISGNKGALRTLKVRAPQFRKRWPFLALLVLLAALFTLYPRINHATTSAFRPIDSLISQLHLVQEKLKNFGRETVPSVPAFGLNSWRIRSDRENHASCLAEARFKAPVITSTEEAEWCFYQKHHHPFETKFLKDKVTTQTSRKESLL